MTSAEKKLQIINMGLMHFAQSPITQVEFAALSNPAAIAADAFWDPCRDEVLGESNWPFANCTQTLSAIDTATDCEWSFIYSYPTLAVSTIWNVFDEGSTTTKGEQDFEVKYIPALLGKYIFSNLEDAIAEYTCQVTDPLLWDNKFCMAMSYNLGSKMVMPVTGDVNKALSLAAIASALTGEAKRIGSSEKTKKSTPSSSYINAR